MAPIGGDLRRVVDGASLVLVESFKRAPLNNTDGFQNLAKRVVLSATDLVGITSGTTVPHRSKPKARDSVVYFSHHHQPDEHRRQNQHQPPDSLVDSNVEDVVSSTASEDVPPGHAVPIEEKQEIGVTTSVVIVGEKEQIQQEHDRPTVTIVSSQGDALRRRRPRERRVPSTPVGRALGFAGLGAGLAWGTIQESARRIVYGSPSSADNRSPPVSPFMSEKNAERLALALCRMRGAALKLGQMLSIQDESLVPAPILTALDIVRQGADVMPRRQLNGVLGAELGPDWSKKLKSFDYEPLAAASIGQVHRAVMKDDLVVAMKIQYPGVADSIDSDIENVKRLLDYTNLVPKGLFLDRAIKVAKEELSRECDYELEARSQKQFRKLLSKTEGVYVPMVIDDISSKRVLTTELVTGVPIDKVAALNQETRNYVGRKLLEVTLKELFVFRFMQTDPNWSNFLYNEATKMINLIDFGASREYSKGFVDDYLRMVVACANRDKDSVIEMSTRLGFLTGMESEVMLDAHVQASFIIGLPFSTSNAYEFGSSNITSSISHLGATMLKHRLTPPPDEAYSLHRKLSGAFLACIKLRATIPCRDLLLQVYQHHRFSDENEEIRLSS